MARLAVFVLSKSPAKARGTLHRCMLEIAPGVFVGRLPPRVIDSLWDEMQKHDAQAVCVTSAANEFGFGVRSHGTSNREIIDHYGVPLVRMKRAPRDAPPR